VKIQKISGNAHFDGMVRIHLRRAGCIIITYDITDQRSFDVLAKWFNIIYKCDHNNDRTAIMIVGTKLDLENKREVETEWGKAIADQHSCMFMETSALDNTNVEEAFKMVIRKAQEIKLRKEKEV